MKPILIRNQKRNNEFMNKNSNRGFQYVDEIPLNIKTIFDMKELTIHGCSFSENLKNNFYTDIEDKLSKDFNYTKLWPNK